LELQQLPPDQAVITAINGPVIKVGNAAAFSMNELVLIGPEKLLGEVVRLDRDQATIQVYEDTTGLLPGLSVHGQGLPLYVELGPGLVGRIFDGTQRPLSGISGDTGAWVTRGRAMTALERNKAWAFTPLALPGMQVEPGQVIGEVKETDAAIHHILIPPNRKGRILEIVPHGLHTVDERIALLQDERGNIHEIKLYHPWPVRQIRPYRQRLLASEPLFTGQRVVDFFFPLAKGGTAAIPGGFGTGKTITQHQLSKWADADIIVYIGCGERGNEMAGVLEDFPRLLDPRSGRPLIERTVLIANTSDMPVAAREASIYTGITIAEYYRDMGHHVALMADSTSRWAEALREIAGRLEEMPAEEGFPAYLASRLAEFYERAGAVVTLGGAPGSVSVIGAVSPPGGDFSEPVTQHTKRFVSTFWALDKELASARYFPAINYLASYSGYVHSVANWWQEKAGLDWHDMRDRALAILKEEARLQNIVKLIGEDALPDDQKATYYGAALIKEDFLQQSAYDPIDTYCPAAKQVQMLQIILDFIAWMRKAVTQRIPVYRIMELPVVEDLHRMKSTYKGDDPAPFLAIQKRLEEEFEGLLKKEFLGASGEGSCAC
jgi:V/A-type H+/Na+-transporting ATPase subunit A